MLAAREGAPLVVGGVKANIGHAEPAAGMTGLLKLVLGLEESKAVSNAQLRVLNPHVSNVLGAEGSVLPVQVTAASVVDGNVQQAGSVSSFGYAGTIAHMIMRCSDRPGKHAPSQSLIHRRAFTWRDPTHPFTQLHLSDGSIIPSIVLISSHSRSYSKQV